ncbi:surface polysaccharide O-acyltransferase-like enzyme [Chitinivorax tropicus]|uniref:Surface polysaccharide O-acyltransferase-like enzyme n=1 Tax=Chitinivorax tropicus TaxID=714531 RepID=A0A840MLC0_9PROT|nr:acyltransferase family protein [Chitinivorax tropicus]MBB5019438.1 surface polysaccharide O-acyltransferase-like enzyme [Chitinivorax tropicus]
MAFTQDVSRNFETAKVLAILVVASGHFFPASAYWVIVSVALCMFGFASGYFTAQHYGPSPTVWPFIRNKLTRLGPDLLAINLLLLVVFIAKGEDHILSWQSLIGMLGLTGFLNWLHLPNPSPFGGGLWYFTLLLVFYVCYPALAKLLRPGAMGAILTAALLAGAFFLTHYVPYGHMLWLTAFAFCFGVAYVNQSWQANIRNTLSFIAVAMAVGGIAKFGLSLPINSLMVITVLSIMALQGLLSLRLPAWCHAPLKPFGPCVLEIYFLHTHLFVHPTGWAPIDFMISLLVILGASYATKQMALIFQRQWFPAKAQRAA